MSSGPVLPSRSPLPGARLPRAALVALAVLVAACGSSTPSAPTPPATADDREQTTAALQSAWAVWSVSRPAAYRYTARRACFCLERGPAVVTVRAGRVESVVDAVTGEPLPPERSQLYTTIDGLFALLFQAVEQQAWAIRASYDAHRGYPRDGYVDPSTRIADEELGFSVEDFEPL